MTKKLLVFLTMGIFSLSAVIGCDKKKEEEKADKTEKAVEDEKEEEKVDEKEEEKVDEEEKAEEGEAAEGDACAQWEKCCKDYAEVLSKLDGVPESAVEATKKGCEQIEQLKGTPGAEEGCKMAMETMKKASEAFKAMPGFELPASCQ